jgi:hypothetical protein
MHLRLGHRPGRRGSSAGSQRVEAGRGGGREAGVLRVLGVCLGRRDLRTYTEVTGLSDEREGGGCGGA